MDYYEFYDKNDNFQNFNEENIDDINYDLSNSNSLTQMQFKAMIEMEQNDDKEEKNEIKNNDKKEKEKERPNSTFGSGVRSKYLSRFHKK